jgi:hypothetical protein
MLDDWQRVSGSRTVRIPSPRSLHPNIHNVATKEVSVKISVYRGVHLKG